MMTLLTDNRASRILYNYLESNHFEKPFLVPVNVCSIIPKVFAETGTPIEFVDINRDSLCLDLEFLCKDVSSYSGVLFVHTYGTERSFENDFKRIKNSHPDFQIIDDRCLCFPRWESVESSADLLLFSVGEKKQVDCGRGGIAFIKEGIRYLSQPLKVDSVLDDYQWEPEFNSLKVRTEESLRHKKTINAIYQGKLPKYIQLDEEFQNWRFNILVDNKEFILKELFDNRLFASSHYSPIVPMDGNALALHNRIINLFNDFYYTEEMALKTCEIILRCI